MIDNVLLVIASAAMAIYVVTGIRYFLLVVLIACSIYFRKDK